MALLFWGLGIDLAFTLNYCYALQDRSPALGEQLGVVVQSQGMGTSVLEHGHSRAV